MADRRTQWLAWKAATFGDGHQIWHEGLDTAAVTGLGGAARTQALAMLRLGLALDDEHAAQALSAMRDRSSGPALRELLARSGGATRVRVALALHQLKREPALAEHLIAVLREPADGPPTHGSGRLDAVIGLRHFGDRADEAALLEAVGDPHYLIRYHACGSLLHRWGVTPADVAEHPAIFALIREPADGAPDAATRRGHAEARELLRAHRTRRS